jgi:hypothetical protein
MKLKVGQKIFGKFGWAKIKNIVLVEVVGEKEGIEVQEVWMNLIERCVFDMDNGHFEYGSDIDYNPF